MALKVIYRSGGQNYPIKKVGIGCLKAKNAKKATALHTHCITQSKPAKVINEDGLQNIQTKVNKSVAIIGTLFFKQSL